VDNNRVINITDPIDILRYLIGGLPSCLDAADFNDDGKVDITDAVSSLDSSSGRARHHPRRTRIWARTPRTMGSGAEKARGRGNPKGSAVPACSVYVLRGRFREGVVDEVRRPSIDHVYADCTFTSTIKAE